MLKIHFYPNSSQIPKNKTKLKADSRRILALLRLPWELSSLIAAFGACFICAEILLNSSLCFSHVESSFQSPGDGSEVAQRHDQLRFPGPAWAAGVGPFVLIFSACGFALSPERNLLQG